MSPNSFLTPLARYRWAVGARSVLGAGGAYAVAAAWAACAGLLFERAGMPRVDAVTTATMLSFIVFACAAMRVFAVAGLRRAAIEVAAATAVPALVAWSMMGSAP